MFCAICVLKETNAMSSSEVVLKRSSRPTYLYRENLWKTAKIGKKKFNELVALKIGNIIKQSCDKIEKRYAKMLWPKKARKPHFLLRLRPKRQISTTLQAFESRGFLKIPRKQSMKILSAIAKPSKRYSIPSKPTSRPLSWSVSRSSPKSELNRELF